MRILNIIRIIFILVRCKYWLRGDAVSRLGHVKYTCVKALFMTSAFAYELARYNWMPSISGVFHED